MNTDGMMAQIATSPEQSGRLVTCGIDPKTADFVWLAPYQYLSLNVGCNTAMMEVGDVPAWSLSALLSLLPKVITDENDDTYYLTIAQEFPQTNEYGVSYRPCWFDGDALTRTRDNSPIEACVQMIEWLTANNYKLNYNG